MIKRMERHLLDCVIVLVDCMHELAFPRDETISHSSVETHALSGALKETTKERQLLLLISNCAYTKSVVLPQLFHLFISTYHSIQSAARKPVDEDDEDADDDDTTSSKPIEQLIESFNSKDATKTTIEFYDQLSKMLEEGLSILVLLYDYSIGSSKEFNLVQVCSTWY